MITIISLSIGPLATRTPRLRRANASTWAQLDRDLAEMDRLIHQYADRRSRELGAALREPDWCHVGDRAEQIDLDAQGSRPHRRPRSLLRDPASGTPEVRGRLEAQALALNLKLQQIAVRKPDDSTQAFGQIGRGTNGLMIQGARSLPADGEGKLWNWPCRLPPSGIRALFRGLRLPHVHRREPAGHVSSRSMVC
jgi:hypothetical protein